MSEWAPRPALITIKYIIFIEHVLGFICLVAGRAGENLVDLAIFMVICLV